MTTDADAAESDDSPPFSIRYTAKSDKSSMIIMVRYRLYAQPCAISETDMNNF